MPAQDAQGTLGACRWPAVEEGPAASWEIQAGEGPSMCGPPGRLLLGGNQVDTSLQLGSSTSLPLPESSPLTHSLNKYLSAPTAASGVHFAALGARWVQGVVISPGAGGGGLGGNRCAPSAPRAAPAKPGASALPGWMSLLKVSPPSADGLSALSRAQWGRGLSLTPGRDPRPWPPGLGTLSCVGDQGLHHPVGCHKERFGGFRGGARQPIVPPSGSPGPWKPHREGR